MVLEISFQALKLYSVPGQSIEQLFAPGKQCVLFHESFLVFLIGQAHGWQRGCAQHLVESSKSVV